MGDAAGDIVAVFEYKIFSLGHGGADTGNRTFGNGYTVSYPSFDYGHIVRLVYSGIFNVVA